MELMAASAYHKLSTSPTRADDGREKSGTPDTPTPTPTPTHEQQQLARRRRKGGCAGLRRRCNLVLKQQRTRLYILRRCVTMLLCWHEHDLSD